MSKRVVILTAILLLVSSVYVFTQTDETKNSSDEILFENVEKYLNQICTVSRTFLNRALTKMNRLEDNYNYIGSDIPVRLFFTEGLVMVLDWTEFDNPIIYVSSGYILMKKNEAELVSSIAHELGHFSSSYDRNHCDDYDYNYLKSETLADRAAIFVLNEMGYGPETTAELYGRILANYADKIKWIRSKHYFVRRFQIATVLAEKIRSSQPNKEYKEYIVFPKSKFISVKTIVLYLQDKYCKSER